jgi:hypothetical protein
MSTPGSFGTVSCYNGQPQNDAYFTSISVAQTHENMHQRAICIATVDLATDTLRANTITANELQATQIILGDPITAGTFVDSGTVGPQGIAIPSIVQFTGSGGTLLALTVDTANDIVLNSSADGVIVGSDGWYQISLEIQNAASVAVADPRTSVGIAINGLTSTFVGLDSIRTTPQIASGSTLILLSAGDLVQIYVLTTAVLETVSGGPVRLDVVRLGP